MSMRSDHVGNRGRKLGLVIQVTWRTTKSQHVPDSFAHPRPHFLYRDPTLTSLIENVSWSLRDNFVGVGGGGGGHSVCVTVHFGRREFRSQLSLLASISITGSTAIIMLSGLCLLRVVYAFPCRRIAGGLLVTRWTWEFYRSL